MPVPVDSFEKVFCGDDVLLLPLILEFGSDNLEILIKSKLIFLIFEEEPDKDKLLIKILSRFKDLDFGAFLSFNVFHIQDVGDECIGDLPRRVDFDKVCKVVVDRWEKFVLDRGLILFEGFAGN